MIDFFLQRLNEFFLILDLFFGCFIIFLVVADFSFRACSIFLDLIR